MRIADGALMGGLDGRLWKVFNPPWWKLHRWVWWRFYRGAKGRMQVTGQATKSLRIYAQDELELPNVPGQKPHDEDLEKLARDYYGLPKRRHPRRNYWG